MHDFWDAPLAGIFDCDGHPHLFERQFSEELDDYSDEFLIIAVDQEALDLALEAEAIHRRWRDAYSRGEVAWDYRGDMALPEDRARKAELTGLLKGRLEIDPKRAKRVIGRVEVVGMPNPNSWLHWSVARPQG
ncbi:MAG: hypothetical protein QNJ30_18610 [Kiloniellales bacterium]|nr:hypothetical protein [Kiloniellales bacterium]